MTVPSPGGSGNASWQLAFPIPLGQLHAYTPAQGLGVNIAYIRPEFRQGPDLAQKAYTVRSC